MTLFTLIFVFLTACSNGRNGEGGKCSTNADCAVGLGCSLNTSHETMAFKCINVMKWETCKKVCHDPAFPGEWKACSESCQQEAVGMKTDPEIVRQREAFKKKRDASSKKEKGKEDTKSQKTVKVKAAGTLIKAVEAALEMHHMRTGGYPSKLEDAKAYMKDSKVPKDPWNNPIEYTTSSSCGKPFEVRSLGSDGQKSDDDITNCGS